MKLHIRHTTDYRYTEPLRYALQTLWLTPQSSSAQTVHFWSVGAPEKLFAQKDAFGNTMQSYTFVGQVADNVRWSLVNAAGDVETCGVAEFVDAETLPHPYFFLRATHLAEPHWQLAEFGRQFISQSADGTDERAAGAALACRTAGAASARDAVLDREADDLRGVAQLELGHEARSVGRRGAFADVHLQGAVLQAHAAAHEAQQLELALAELVEAHVLALGALQMLRDLVGQSR